MFDVFTGGDVRVLLSCRLDLCVDILKVKVTQSCPTLCDPMDNTVYGILQARILECVAFPFSRGASQPRDWTRVFCIAGRFFQFSSVQSRPTLCNPMDCSTPGLPVLQYHPELAQTHVHRVSDAIQPSHPLSSPSPPAFNLSQDQGLFKWVSSLHQVAKGLGLQLQQQPFQWILRTDFL